MTGPALTHALRELIWSLESEGAVITSLSRRLDEHVAALNDLPRELAERLSRLDEVVDSADEPELRAALRSCTAVPLPLEDEVFPERLYG